jgi:flagellar motility protein MotE (MotC chaperone)
VSVWHKVLALLVRLAAALFLLVLAGAAALYLSGRLSRENLQDIWAVMSGTKRVVDQSKYESWKAMEEQARHKTAVEQEEQKGSGEANTRFQRQRDHWAWQWERERAVLGVIEETIAKRRESLSAERRTFGEVRQAFLKKKRDQEDAEKQANLKKVLKLYRGMEPEMVARDFLTRWRKGTKAEKGQVVDLLRRMPARLSAEIISAIDDPALRVEIMREMRNS